MIVGRPGRELLGASLGIVLQAAQRFDRGDRGERVFDRLRARSGLPTELHAAARAVRLRARAVCPFGRIESLEFGGAAVLRSRIVKERRLDP